MKWTWDVAWIRALPGPLKYDHTDLPLSSGTTTSRLVIFTIFFSNNIFIWAKKKFLSKFFFWEKTVAEKGEKGGKRGKKGAAAPLFPDRYFATKTYSDVKKTYAKWCYVSVLAFQHRIVMKYDEIHLTIYGSKNRKFWSKIVDLCSKMN